MDSLILLYRKGQLFGFCLDIFLYGVLSVQTYLYYIAFPGDKNITKAIVAFICIINTAQTTLALTDFYKVFCVGEIIQGDLMWLTISLSCALVTAIAQIFYAHRIYTLSKKKLVTGIVIVLAVAQLILGGIGSAVGFHQFVGIPLAGQPTPWIWGGTGMLCDLIIAVYMTWFLTMQLKRSTRKTTQVMLTKVKRLILETGLLTVVLTIAYPLLLTFALGTTYTIPGLSLGKIYSNSILVLLNNRFVIANGRNEPAFEFEIKSYHSKDVARRESAEAAI